MTYGERVGPDRALTVVPSILFSISACLLEFDPALLDGCHGCNDGVTCLPGDSAAACGRGGASCTTCSTPTDACFEGRCVIQYAATELSASAVNTAVIDRQGGLWIWGSNDSGLLGPPETPQTI